MTDIIFHYILFLEKEKFEMNNEDLFELRSEHTAVLRKAIAAFEVLLGIPYGEVPTFGRKINQKNFKPKVQIVMHYAEKQYIYETTVVRSTDTMLWVPWKNASPKLIIGDDVRNIQQLDTGEIKIDRYNSRDKMQGYWIGTSHLDRRKTAPSPKQKAVA